MKQMMTFVRFSTATVLLFVFSGCGAHTTVGGMLAGQSFVAQSSTTEHNPQDDSYSIMVTAYEDSYEVTQHLRLVVGDPVLTIAFAKETSEIPVPSPHPTQLGICYLVESQGTPPVMCASQGHARVVALSGGYVTIELDVAFPDGSVVRGELRSAIHPVYSALNEPY